MLQALQVLKQNREKCVFGNYRILVGAFISGEGMKAGKKKALAINSVPESQRKWVSHGGGVQRL